MSILVGAQAPVFINLVPEDVRRPRQVWRFHNEVVGDASGGYVAVNTLLRDANKPTRALFSLEGVSPHILAEVTCSVYLSLSGTKADGPSAAEAAWKANLIMVGSGNGAQTAPQADQLSPFRGWFPFEYDPVYQLILQTRFTTNTNGAYYVARAWGYIWDGRCLDVGGPLRI